jgi:NitT/TauT family transport system substrate-binding protein
MAMQNEAGMAMDHAMMSDVDTVMGGMAVFRKYHGWPELKEAFMGGSVRAVYILAPMLMDIVDQGIPAKVVALGHRSGAVIMVGKDSPARNFGDLKGKRVAIPSRFAVDHLYVRRLMAKYGLRDGDVSLIEMPPPDMPAALYAGAVDAYATGEPFGATSEVGGYGRPLHMTQQDWPDYICCVLAVRQDLIDTDRATVQKLVNYVLSSGTWLDSLPDHRTIAAQIAADPVFFNQDPRIIQYVMEHPPDRVTYGNLRLVKEEFDEIMQLAVDAGILRRPVAYETYADESFIQTARAVEIFVGR